MPVRFYLYPMPNKKGECPIRVSISIGSTRFIAWEEGKGVKAKYTNSKGVTSKMINARITSIQAHFMTYELKKEFKQAIIGTHAGRRTFICFALSQGIAPQVVMKWTGHSDYKAMNLFEKGLKK